MGSKKKEGKEFTPKSEGDTPKPASMVNQAGWLNVDATKFKDGGLVEAVMDSINTNVTNAEVKGALLQKLAAGEDFGELYTSFKPKAEKLGYKADKEADLIGLLNYISEKTPATPSTASTPAKPGRKTNSNSLTRRKLQSGEIIPKAAVERVIRMNTDFAVSEEVVSSLNALYVLIGEKVTELMDKDLKYDGKRVTMKERDLLKAFDINGDKVQAEIEKYVAMRMR